VNPDPALSVVVGTLDRLAQLRQCLDSIVSQTRTPVRVYVTDAGSTDGTIEYLRSIGAGWLVPILTGRRLGQARAYNDVFAQVATPYVCWLSDDNVVVDRGLDRAIAILEDEPAIGMVALKVRDMMGPFARSPYIGGISDVGILNVNQGVLRTRVLRAVGGFSETFRDYGIDPDLTARPVTTSSTRRPWRCITSARGARIRRRTSTAAAWHGSVATSRCTGASTPRSGAADSAGERSGSRGRCCASPRASISTARVPCSASCRATGTTRAPAGTSRCSMRGRAGAVRIIFASRVRRVSARASRRAS
jgi:hypothetical protein